MIEKEGSLAAFLWRFYETDESTLPPPETQTTCEASVACLKNSKAVAGNSSVQQHWYAFMQSMRLINDHAEDCFNARRK